MDAHSTSQSTPTRPIVFWSDLRHYSSWEIIRELTLPLPWLIVSLIASTYEWYLVTIIAAFYFFLTGLRVTHNAFHYCLGLSKFATDIVMLILSILMLGSLHAVQLTHLQHHRHCLGENDVEGEVARYSFWAALLKGPIFPIRIHTVAWKAAHGNQKRWINIELACNCVWLLLVWVYWDNTALKIHTALMAMAYCLSAFFAVWTVHHDCEHDNWNNARTIRSAWKSYLFYNMFYHIEHHLYPQVPTCHLPELARRIDKQGYCQHKNVI